MAQKGGNLAGDAREKLEIESGEKVIRKDNYLKKPQSQERIEDIKGELKKAVCTLDFSPDDSE